MPQVFYSLSDKEPFGIIFQLCSQTTKNEMRPENSPPIGNRRSFEPANNGQKNTNVRTGLLSFFSVINIVIYNVCVGLEAFHPYVGQGFWGSSVYLVSGLLGFGASYHPTYTRLTWVLAFSCISVLFGFIVSGLSWAGYTDCDHYYPDYDSDVDDCNRPTSQLALMIFNIFAIFVNAFVTILVSSPLCCADKSTTQNFRNTSTSRVATIDIPTDASDISTATRTGISPTGIHIFSSHRPEMEILSRLALFASRQEEEEERPPRYSLAVAESSDVHEIII